VWYSTVWLSGKQQCMWILVRIRIRTNLSDQDPDPHWFGSLDPDLHRDKKLDPDPIRITKQTPDKQYTELRNLFTCSIAPILLSTTSRAPLSHSLMMVTALSRLSSLLMTSSLNSASFISWLPPAGLAATWALSESWVRSDSWKIIYFWLISVHSYDILLWIQI
jgi:hypothetical protein